MNPGDKQIRISKALAQKLFPLAVSVCLLVSLVIPGVYGYLEFNRFKKEAGLYSRQFAGSIRQLAAKSPNLWKYQATKYSEIIETFTPNKGILSITVLDGQLNPISQFSHREKEIGLLGRFGINGDPAQIKFNNTTIGEIHVRVAAKAFLVTAMAIFSFCLIIGLILSMVVYKLPLGVVRRLEGQLLKYQNSLESLVAQRTAELEKTAEKALQLAEARRYDQEALLEAKTTLEQRVRERTLALKEQVTAKEQALSELAEIQSSLLEMSRAAGMSEVATGVLHNVGNVLNSVNVSCTLIMDQLRESRMGRVTRVANLMAEYGRDLGRFLTRNPKGQQIPSYLTSLGAVLEEEHQMLLDETKALHDRINHIKEIVAMQQTYGRVSGVLETMAPEQLMEDALKLNAEELTRNDITVDRQYQPVPSITVDKNKVLQIVLNLINNARHACTEGTKSEKRITLKVFSSGDDRLNMQVSDNGVGIFSEHLTRIFEHGFTTRKSGHGFGLHSGALAAKELGGSLTAHSDGPDRGATFTLELPYNPGDRQ